MVSFLGRRKNRDEKVRNSTDTSDAGRGSGYRFTMKGSPRHYDDVRNIIHAGGGTVYFGEALTYERGAGVALWRVRCEGFDWLPRLYEWWAESERVEPINVTFHLYLPSDLKYPALDLRQHTPAEVEAFIRANAPYEPAPLAVASPRR
ncbi:MAG: hypothetical protein AVDCRST_MAG49-323 [uncultured Thermomicrobiales bacterium]|uniref:Uncharacterized protein n=1 Tax=uncultured Thermomicrobiales bacterium TaxID=1645740 RepID=A0A6J4TZP8_9BACT|nr:MAG: hypothetical protein AVDCRST_MAG49-323 [uncultured Thermomicrobiales bacterium]